MAAEDGGLFAEDAEMLSEEDSSSEGEGDGSEEGSEEEQPDASESEDEMEKLIAQAADKVTTVNDDGGAADDNHLDAKQGKNKNKKKKMRWKDRKSIFINQLPYSATDAQILAHFSACAATEDMEVRRVINKKNGKFRGIAFIDVKTEEAQEKALTLDQSAFSNGEGERTINVRKAVEKGNESDKELTARQVQKKKAAETSAENIEKLLNQAVTSGAALSSDFDDRSRDFLKTVPEAIATAAIEDFCALDKTKVNNRYDPRPILSYPTERSEDNIQFAIRCFTLAGPCL
jgi:RNA recognition motif-containing protein